VNEQGGAYFVDRPWTWRDRLRARAFPVHLCPLPQPLNPEGDVLTVRTLCVLPWLERLRVLASGRLIVETRTVTEHKVGNTDTATVAYPCWR
jgi:hypothetical protein